MTDPFHRYQQGRLQHQPKSVEQDIPPKPDDPQGPSEFERELESLINRHSMENASGTPDFILAQYLTGALYLFNATIQQRANWRDESVDLPALQKPAGKKVPLVDYSTGHRNEVGEAYVTVWPGESETYDQIDSVITVQKNLPPVEGTL